MQKGKPRRAIHPPQRQRRPGLENRMKLPPVFDSEALTPGKMLEGKRALISGGDSGIGRAVAVAFARHGADVVISYLREEADDALTTKAAVESYGRKCLLFPGDISREQYCSRLVEKAVTGLGGLDILVNNAGMQFPADSIESITNEHLQQTFATNVFSMFYLVKAALLHLAEGSCIINTASVTAYRGSAHLIDYSATKGAIVSFTRSLAASLTDRKIRVNAVAPGPVWTPLIVSSMKPDEIKTFGSDSPMGRPGQPVEIATCYLFLASAAASYITGQVLHPNGGEVVNC